MIIPDYAIIIPSTYVAIGLGYLAATRAFEKYGDSGKATLALSVGFLKFIRRFSGV